MRLAILEDFLRALGVERNSRNDGMNDAAGLFRESVSSLDGDISEIVRRIREIAHDQLFLGPLEVHLSCSLAESSRLMR
jgi:hypothetical protein